MHVGCLSADTNHQRKACTQHQLLPTQNPSRCQPVMRFWIEECCSPRAPAPLLLCCRLDSQGRMQVKKQEWVRLAQHTNLCGAWANLQLGHCLCFKCFLRLCQTHEGLQDRRLLRSVRRTLQPCACIIVSSAECLMRRRPCPICCFPHLLVLPPWICPRVLTFMACLYFSHVQSHLIIKQKHPQPAQVLQQEVGKTGMIRTVSLQSQLQERQECKWSREGRGKGERRGMTRGMEYL